MNYRKLDHSSSLFLSRHIKAIYELNSDEQELIYKTIPNGIIGLTFLTSGSAWSMVDDRWEAVPKVALYGMVKKPTLIKVSKNCRDISIGFNPVFLASLLKIPMQVVADRFTDACYVFRQDDLNELEDALLGSLQDDRIILAVEKFLLNYFKKEVDEQLLSAYHQISHISYTRVDDLSKSLNLSSRTLLNKFKDKIGLSPKELMQIFRINSSLNIKKHQPDSLTDLAIKLGYFDQSHFIHDFKQTLGISPEQYFKNNLLISDFYNSERWNLS